MLNKPQLTGTPFAVGGTHFSTLIFTLAEKAPPGLCLLASAFVLREIIPETGPLLPRPTLCQPGSPFPGGTHLGLTWEVVVCGLVLGHGGSSGSELSAPFA